MLEWPCCCCGRPTEVGKNSPQIPGGALDLGAIHQIIREATPETVEPPAAPTIFDRPSLKTPRVEDYPMVPPQPVASVPAPSSGILFTIMLIAIAAARR